ncbi:MAG: S-methyl-5'-thioadenosine phosphorylase [Deltaproteobacteria bacterium]|nr:S-methyl-5'-thioadenosine phosphorylase [Deltaproteobacteria bacterium]
MLLGITGGSGFYSIKSLNVKEKRSVWTPFGMPSSDLIFGEIDGNSVVFLARHGEGHTIPPHNINYRANIWALKNAGVTHLVAVSAVGSLREDLPPGTFVAVDQFIDFTKNRKSTFFDDLACHVSFAEPVCSELADMVILAAENSGVDIAKNGTYICIEGPEFSSKAESAFFRLINASVIGMTNVTEARLAKEAELHFSTLAMVTDYDCWREEETPVTVETVMDTIRQNGEKANSTIENLVKYFKSGSFKCNTCNNSLSGAIMTDMNKLSSAKREELKLFTGRFHK